MQADCENYAVHIGTRLGKRYAERHPLNVPLDLARGRYERLSDDELLEALNDLTAEATRRGQHHRYDPMLSQIRRGDGFLRAA